MSTPTVSKLMILSLLTFLAISVPSISISSEAYNQSCQISFFDPTFPSSVGPGQTVQVNTTIGVQCAQWRTYYSARVDLLDRRTQRLFSTSTFQIGWQPNVTTTVSNGAVAPQSNGPWALQLNLYIFEEAGEVANFNHVFNIQVGNPVANVQQTTPTTLATTATSQTSLPLENIPATSNASSGLGEQFYILIALTVAAVLCAVLILATRKRAT